MSTQAKLTLRLNKQLISIAKTQAQKTGKSLSSMVADYFSLLEKENSAAPETLSPLTQSLKGALKKGKIINKQDYYEHLESKYL